MNISWNVHRNYFDNFYQNFVSEENGQKVTKLDFQSAIIYIYLLSEVSFSIF